MEAAAFGVMHVDEDRRVTAFLEKPADPPAMPGKPDIALASMGIYVFETPNTCWTSCGVTPLTPTRPMTLARISFPISSRTGRRSHIALRTPVSGRNRKGSLLARCRNRRCLLVSQCRFDGCGAGPRHLRSGTWPIWTYNEVTPPAKFVHDEDGRRGSAISSLVSGACIVSGAALRKTLLSTGARVNSFATVENAVILPRVDVGRSARLRNVVIDAEVEIPEGLVVGEDPELDAKRFRRTEHGICLITQPMIDKLLDQPWSTRFRRARVL